MGKRGPQPILPTDEQRRLVRAYSGYGIPQRDIALLIGKSIDWLDKHCRAELDVGLAEVHAKVGRTLVAKALAGDTACLIFYAKSQMGYREVSKFEHSGTNGGPIRTIDLTRLLEGKSEDELRNIEHALELLTTAGAFDGSGADRAGAATGQGEAAATGNGAGPA